MVRISVGRYKELLNEALQVAIKKRNPTVDQQEMFEPPTLVSMFQEALNETHKAAVLFVKLVTAAADLFEAGAMSEIDFDVVMKRLKVSDENAAKVKAQLEPPASQ